MIDISKVMIVAMNPAKANFFTGFTSPCYCAVWEAQLIFRSHLVHCDGNSYTWLPRSTLRPTPPRRAPSLGCLKAWQLAIEGLQD